MINSSKFSMWRACISVVHLDGRLSTDEDHWVKQKIQSLPLSNEQKAILEGDLANGLDFDKVIQNITEPKDKAFLLHLVRVISYLDGDFSRDEKQAYAKLEKIVLGRLDLAKFEEQAQAIEDASYKNVPLDNKSSLFEAAIKNIISFLTAG
ncbi:MAG: hypothetical protein COW01_06355 [Bdellovibrionales bacterium CG12_big_fil_rev_8_21_14_0_65_38_15]|nr:MAG: hypothetical protein COW79_10435 [Bdellovibrionales bacterium CG22_combo_CG10-13_8_21_14_all_38_13]PIQ55811.1 MAG: hypothetical protein COW01_06355 [Bdellovibrionales bacterium CG12_big_fil_rev_8_21_14_0_65_38_15]PIR28715.1 MAG: hypothetical protein COV38_14340 [Bdellovibrionales bacterium CG11_big_fil_rev_8_21_14_0_20_38_13]